MDIVKEFFTNTPQLGPVDTLINIVLSSLIAFLIRLVYIKYGTSLSNRKHFGNSFLLITICTTLIISLIQSSIALSLGLVGALSIVRFRTAIKEPQELTYIFLCIAVGLGFGANERILTIAAALLILFILIIVAVRKKDKIEEAYNLTIKSKTMDLEEIISISGEFCKRVDLRRFDEKTNALNVILFVEFDEYKNLKECIKALKDIDNNVEINFVSTRILG